ncbi:4-aminobutyrate--2-oxoglutarate transaminase [Oleiagrimonas sp.]|jgi:4-aminobutyrate aminotransferase/(S)-3-amino-2-methylpropionate transaminase|uniref:4-aminobutyrate--2-oxoglutarate transaminase n=1 Tax=Oleiagrimonas sp. TaxID=2010330 RepID=UPI00261804D3|nr:4-aminobutyrate--2-oxoglutarate transaminase [Oleiagrimonas sp.]MDA3914234.1 4-aminobutyrate--2-oxoglutarate transaminase [Oleiagrimonas sp.]
MTQTKTAPGTTAASASTTNSALQSRREKAVVRGVSTLLPRFIERAENAQMWDVEGKRYIDFAGGIAVLNTGHLHPRVQAAVAEQMQRFSHTCFQINPYEGYVRLAERLNALVPGAGPHKTLLLSTGAEAVENAVKIARAHTGRPAVIAFSGAFHGRTMMGMALTGKVVPYKAGFGPLPSSVYHLPFPVAYHGVTVEDARAAMQTLFKSEVEPERVAAIIIEPVQGEGGFYPADAAFLRELRELCDRHGIVLVIDEIQSGFARSGRMFAIEHSGVEPDIVTMAKSLAGGFPLSAVTGKASIMDAPGPGGLGGTFAGSPIGCAAANAVLDIIEDEQLCARAGAIGQRLTAALTRMRQAQPMQGAIGDVRGLGAMVAMELVHDGDAARPDADLTRALVQRCAEDGLIVLPCGVYGNVIRFLVPLTASDELIDEGMAVLETALSSLLQKGAKDPA